MNNHVHKFANQDGTMPRCSSTTGRIPVPVAHDRNGTDTIESSSGPSYSNQFRL